MFKKGDTVICLIDSNRFWANNKTLEKVIGPQKGEILKIEEVCSSDGYLIFKEYGIETYDSVVFKKLNIQNNSLEIKLETKKVLETEKIIAN